MAKKDIKAPATESAIDAIEAEILAKGLTALRVTPGEIDAAIKFEFYLNAAEAVGAVGHDGLVGDVPLAGSGVEALQVMTVCFLVLQNGFIATGESACISPENYDQELGRKIARENARNKIWALEGYRKRSEGQSQAQLQIEPKKQGGYGDLSLEAKRD